MIETKIIAMYLPQFHCIPENDRFWGKGFTDWITVKKAKPLFKGHQQPRVPLGGEYYDLSLERNVVWQSQLAEKYGIYGFGVYHYWFNNEKNLLTKPAEIIRDSQDVNIHYFLAWDNANWKRNWSNVEGNDWAPLFDDSKLKNESAVLVHYVLGDEKDWENHYWNISKHFHSEKYIKVGNKPVFMIFNYDDEIDKMCKYWESLSKKDGFDGVHFIMKKKDMLNIPDHYFSFKYEPIYSGWRHLSIEHRLENRIRRFFRIDPRVYKYDYDKIWKSLINNARNNVTPQVYHGAFVSYDDSPRRGKRGSVVLNADPIKFLYYLRELVSISQEQNKQFIFITAWNEWGEGSYLEPDTINAFSYLDAIKSICI